MASVIAEPHPDHGAQDKEETCSRHLPTGRLARELKTLHVMIQLYCKGQHRRWHTLCPDCQGLLGYAVVRLERCRFGPQKPTCVNCPVHCYQRDRREQVKAVMRFAGPRMLWTHPILSLRHWLDGRAGLSAVDHPKAAG